MVTPDSRRREKCTATGPLRAGPGTNFFLLTLSAALVSCSADEGRSNAPLFTLLPPAATGVTFTNALPENPLKNGFSYEYYYNGGGVAAGDLNGDDLPDLYFTANVGPNRLYLNRGRLHFEDVTERSGVAGRDGWATGVTMADVNADGRLDIYISYSGPYADPDQRRNVLYVNQGVRDGVPFFRDEAAAYGLDDPAYSTQAAFFDADGDGDLDMYLMNHGVPGYRSLEELRAGQSRDEVDRLYRNDGGTFTDVTARSGLVDTNLGFGLGLSIGDLNNDRHPDIYVGNDYSGRDYLYLGQRVDGFRDVLVQSMAHIPLASMGSDIGDVDGDGWLDVIVLEMAMTSHYDRNTVGDESMRERFSEMLQGGQHYQYAANALQWNRGLRNGEVPVFSEIAHYAGVAATDWSWAPLLADLDNDGRPDLFASNGMAGGAINADFNAFMQRRVQEVRAVEGRLTHSLMEELLARLPRRRVPNHAYRNEGDLRFTKRTAAWGLEQPAYSYGAVYADLDRDGDLELVVNNLMGEAFLYRNESREKHGTHFLAVRLQGAAPNSFGIGARVRLKVAGQQQVQELQLTRGYQSSVEPVLHFGLGAQSVVDTLEVVWPDGAVERLHDVAADRTITLDRRAGVPAAARAATVLFTGADDALQPRPRHRAMVSSTDTALRPYPTRREEAALAVGDLDGDGLDDFFVGASGAEPARLYRQQPDGVFRGTPFLPARGTGAGVAAAIFDANGDGRSDLWLVARDARGHQHRIYFAAGAAGFRETAAPSLPDAPYVVLAPADYDGDGDIDLFAGARTVAGADSAAGSRLLRNDGGSFTDVTTAVAPALTSLSTVTAASWTDANGDGRLDLIVTGEWLPITLLSNDGQRLVDATRAAGLDALSGWWQSLAVADFDGDGDTDVVAGNIGSNYPYRPTADAPFELHVRDFDGDGALDAIPSYYEHGARYPWFGRARLSELLPLLPARYPTYDAFARATLPEILGAEVLQSARTFAARTFATTYFENVGNGAFRARALAAPAQIAPVTGIMVADFDGDRALDLVLAGNYHALDVTVPRLDAGVGLFLHGDGAGGFTPLMPPVTGLLLEGAVSRLAQVRIGTPGEPALLAVVVGGDMRYIRLAKASGTR